MYSTNPNLGFFHHNFKKDGKTDWGAAVDHYGGQVVQVSQQYAKNPASKGQRALKSGVDAASTGASVGMTLGPWGSAIGGLLGVGYGAYKVYSEKDPTTHAGPENWDPESKVRQGVISSAQTALILRRQPNSSAAMMYPQSDISSGSPVKWSKLNKAKNWAFVQDLTTGTSGFSVWKSKSGTVRIDDTTPLPLPMPTASGISSIPSWVWWTAGLGTLGVAGVALYMRK
jgi:hypothetical protein